MRGLPEGIQLDEVVGALVDGWGFEPATADYAPVGAGSYHWVVRDRHGTPAFVTVDDLDQKSWLGDTRASALDGLRAAFATAAALCEAGLAFVVAPVPTRDGEPLRRIGERHTVALFPFVDGRAGRFGLSEPGGAAALVPLLGRLHRATPAVGALARAVGLELPGRRHVESALRDADRPWSDGPFSEPAREALGSRADDVIDLLALADRLAASVESRGGEWVATHGEPHAGNVMRTGDQRVLVDWDTVALAPPERDLWMLANDPGDETAMLYSEATGRLLDRDALDFFRLTWDLKDLAENLNVLRSPHRETEDTARAFGGLKECVSIRREWAALLD